MRAGCVARRKARVRLLGLYSASVVLNKILSGRDAAKRHTTEREPRPTTTRSQPQTHDRTGGKAEDASHADWILVNIAWCKIPHVLDGQVWNTINLNLNANKQAVGGFSDADEHGEGHFEHALSRCCECVRSQVNVFVGVIERVAKLGHFIS